MIRRILSSSTLSSFLLFFASMVLGAVLASQLPAQSRRPAPVRSQALQAVRALVPDSAPEFQLVTVVNARTVCGIVVARHAVDRMVARRFVYLRPTDAPPEAWLVDVEDETDRQLYSGLCRARLVAR